MGQFLLWTCRCLLLLILMSGVARADCRVRVQPKDAATTAQGIIDGFGAEIAAKEDDPVKKLEDQVKCLGAMPTASQAGVIHLAYALVNLSSTGSARVSHIEAACHLETLEFPKALLSDAAIADYTKTNCQLQDGRVVGPPAGGTATPRPFPLADGYALSVDGVERSTLPADRVALVVILGPRDAWSGMVTPHLVPPPGPWSPEPLPEVQTWPPSPWFVASSGAALTSVALWGAFASQRNDLSRSADMIANGAPPELVDRTAEELTAQIALTRGLAVGAGLSAGLAIGLGTLGWRSSTETDLGGASVALVPGQVLVRW